MQAYVEKGFHHIRVQISSPGYSTYGNKSAKTGNQTTSNKDPLKGPIPITKRIKNYDKNKLYAHPGGVFEPKPYMRSALSLFDSSASYKNNNKNKKYVIFFIQN